MTAPVAVVAEAQQTRLALLSRSLVDRLQERWAQVDRGAVVASWAAQAPDVVRLLSTAQLVAAAQAQEYVALTAGAGPALEPTAFAGVAADGRSLLSLLQLPPVTALHRIGLGAPVEDAMRSGLAQLLLAGQTEVADASRVATQVGIAARPKQYGYVRVVQGGACGRCLILAGRVYRWSKGFDRHPGCHCTMAAVGSAEADMAPDPAELFRRMTPQQQVDSLGSRGAAEAVRAGADLSQVVNAQRGMYVAGDVVKRKFTTEGTTRRGLAGKQLEAAGATVTKAAGERYGRVRVPRPTPAQLFSDLGDDRAGLVAALTRFGYIR